MSDPDTIDWYDALYRIIESGHTIDAAPRMLSEAVNSGAVGYYPRRALSFDRALRTGLFDWQTGAWRMHAGDDHPFFIRPIRSDFQRWLSRQRSPSRAGSETRAIAFLAERLRADHDLKREDAWKSCNSEFPNLSYRRFLSHVWPDARKNAGLQPLAPAGRKKQKR
jgi:hypothetical protein